MQTAIKDKVNNAQLEQAASKPAGFDKCSIRSEISQDKKIDKERVLTLADCEKAPYKDIISKEDYAKLLNSNPKISLVIGKGGFSNIINLVRADSEGKISFNSPSIASFTVFDNKLIQSQSDQKLKVNSFGTNNRFISIEVKRINDSDVYKTQYCFDQKENKEFHLLLTGKEGEPFLDKLKISSRIRKDGLEEPVIILGIDKKTGRETTLSFFPDSATGSNYQNTRWIFNSTVTNGKGIQFLQDTLTAPGEALALINKLPYLKIDEKGTFEVIPR